MMELVSEQGLSHSSRTRREGRNVWEKGVEYSRGRDGGAGEEGKEKLKIVIGFNTESKKSEVRRTRKSSRIEKGK